MSRRVAPTDRSSLSGYPVDDPGRQRAGDETDQADATDHQNHGDQTSFQRAAER
jgi:hypothetical protein